jgi:putative endonuclease
MDRRNSNRKPPAVVWHLYVVATEDGCLYAGITTDVDRRYAEHLAQNARTAKYLRAHKPRRLVFRQAIGPRSLALRVEQRFKRLPRSVKAAIVAAGRLFVDDEATGRLRPE